MINVYIQEKNMNGKKDYYLFIEGKDEYIGSNMGLEALLTLDNVLMELSEYGILEYEGVFFEKDSLKKTRFPFKK